MKGVAGHEGDAEDGSMRTRPTACTLLFMCLVACGTHEASTGSGGDPSSSGSAGAGAGTGGAAGSDGSGAAPVAIVFNEIAAVGTSEWVEIVNPGPNVIDVSGYEIADSVKKTNEPKLADAMRFPPGTKIDPGGRIVILTSKKDATVGPHPKQECLPDGPDTCLFAAFGVSATSGEALHFLAPDGSVITTTAVPKTASADAGGSTTSTECRIPDVTGDFTRCAMTPGQPNRTP